VHGPNNTLRLPGGGTAGRDHTKTCKQMPGQCALEWGVIVRCSRCRGGHSNATLLARGLEADYEKAPWDGD
jgi:hypothetical protein